MTPNQQLALIDLQASIQDPLVGNDPMLDAALSVVDAFNVINAVYEPCREDDHEDCIEVDDEPETRAEAHITARCRCSCHNSTSIEAA